MKNFFSIVKRDASRHLQSWDENLSLLSLIRLVFLTPGFQFVFLLRIQQIVVCVPIIGKFLRRVFWYLNFILFKCDVDPSARVGAGLYAPHPIGIVVGGEWDISEDVSILQGVTLGRTKSPKRRCTVGSGCIIGAGAKVIGQIDLGENSRIGANAVVLVSVPSNAVAVGVPARVIAS